MKIEVERAATEGKMEKLNHTPGPWKIEDGEIIATGPNRDGAAVLGLIYGAEDYPCCDEDIDGECKANGDLIAAAPDLLAALEKLATFVDSIPYGRPYAGRPHAEMDAARAAVAKATGSA